MSHTAQGMPASVSSQEAHRVVSALSVLQVENLSLQRGNNLATVSEPVSSSARSESCSLVSRASSFFFTIPVTCTPFYISSFSLTWFK